MKFLIIEDNNADTEILKRYIQKSFPMSEVHSCTKFRNGVKSLYHDNYDGVFLDLNLPDNWGISSVRELKQYAKAVPIYVTTGFANKITIEEAMKAGATNVSAKRDLCMEVISNIVQPHSMVG